MSGAAGERPISITVTTAGEVAYCDVDSGAAVTRLVDGGLEPWLPDLGEEAPLSGDDAKRQYLSEVDIFRDLTPDELNAIAESAPMRTARRGELLFTPKQPSETLFILKAGQVRVFRINPDGRAMTTALLDPGTVFGEMVLLGQHMYDQYAEATEDSTLCLMDRADVHRYLMANPKIAMRVAELLGTRLIETEQRLADMALKPAPARIASTLYTLARKEYQRIPRNPRLVVAITHEQLADLVGTSRETTTKALGSLAEAGTIKLGRGKITILKPMALKQAAGR